MPDHNQPTTEDLLAEHTAAGRPDPQPQPLQPGDPGYVEPYEAATPVAPSVLDEDLA